MLIRDKIIAQDGETSVSEGFTYVNTGDWQPASFLEVSHRTNKSPRKNYKKLKNEKSKAPKWAETNSGNDLVLIEQPKCKSGRPRLPDSPLRRYWREQKRKQKQR